MPPTNETLFVELRASAAGVTKAFNEAAAAMRSFTETYISLLPWYRRWPLRVRIWLYTQRARIKIWWKVRRWKFRVYVQ